MTDSLSGGYCRGHLCTLVIWNRTTEKKARTHIAGLASYRNGAGSARQEYRTLRGLNVVLAIMHIPLTCWPGHRLSVPAGLELYLKSARAEKLHVLYRFRSQLARDMLDFIVEQLPGRHIRSLADGSYATKDSVRQLPDTAQLVWRVPISAQLYEVPPATTSKRRSPA